jgi:uncharacterized protein (DUF2267 family)
MTEHQLRNKSLLSYPTNFMMESGEFSDEEQAIEVLKASLRALRDRLPKVEAYRLGVQLPESIRHFYFEGWHNGQRQTESVTKSEFLAEVKDHLDTLNNNEDYNLDEMVPVALQALLRVIKDSEVQEVVGAIPRSMQNIFEAGEGM